MIITGAPVELLEFEEVKYWAELTEIMDWANKNVTSTSTYLLGSTGCPLLSLWNRKI